IEAVAERWALLERVRRQRRRSMGEVDERDELLWLGAEQPHASQSPAPGLGQDLAPACCRQRVLTRGWNPEPLRPQYDLVLVVGRQVGDLDDIPYMALRVQDERPIEERDPIEHEVMPEPRLILAGALGRAGQIEPTPQHTTTGWDAA